MQAILRWSLWLLMSVVIVTALLVAPLSQGFEGLYGKNPESSRIVYFHVPLAIASFIAFLAAAAHSVGYLRKRRMESDYAATAAVEVGLLFCVLATVTGGVWAQVQWGVFWNWDPRQTSILLAILFYGAYLALRGAIEDQEVRARISAAYSALGFIVAPFLFFILPRMAQTSLHPKPASAEMDPEILFVVLAGVVANTALFFWMKNLRCRVLALEAARDPLLDDL